MRLSFDRTRARQAILAATAMMAGLVGLGCTEPAALESHPVFHPLLLAQASADECFTGIGERPPPGPPCPASAQDKINQAYVWGLTDEAGRYFFGTAANVHCLVQGGFLGSTAPQEVPSWVCEFGESQLGKLGFPAVVGDWRTPAAYCYDPADGSLSDIRPTDPLFALTLGIRSAGSLGGIVFLAGPDLLQRGVNVFAWDAETKEYLGSHQFSRYTNIRQWLTHRGVLYTAVGRRRGGGRVLRWTGDRDHPFRFEEVGNLDGDGANLSIYRSRQGTHLAVTTWPTLGAGLSPSALWISPPVPRERGLGLTAQAAADWRRVWRITDYEPDPVVALVLGGGAAAFFDGWLYWGTMVVPGLAPALYALVPGGPVSEDAETEDVIRLVLGSWRAITIFRGRHLETDHPEVEVLYGEERLPVFDIASSRWELRPNKMDAKPRFGSSGFGNDYNNYTWVAGVAYGRLLIGTMDWSYLVDAGLFAGLADGLFGPEAASALGSLLTGELTLPNKPSPLFSYVRGHGADLWRFDSSHGPAVPENVRGLGNRFNYGLRSIVAKRRRLVLGTANPMNLETLGTRHGGWELVELVPWRRALTGRVRPGASIGEPID